MAKSEVSPRPRSAPRWLRLLRAVAATLLCLAAIALLLDRVFPLPLPDPNGGSTVVLARDGTPLRAFADDDGVWRYPTTPEQVSGMIALGYGVTYIWGTVGIILICMYLPRWWGVDARKAAREYELAHGVRNVDDAALTGYRGGGLRA